VPSTGHPRLTTQTGTEDTLAGADGGVLSANAELASLALTHRPTPQPLR
jgi:hypothetical protein